MGGGQRIIGLQGLVSKYGERIHYPSRPQQQSVDSPSHQSSRHELCCPWTTLLWCTPCDGQGDTRSKRYGIESWWCFCEYRDLDERRASGHDWGSKSSKCTRKTSRSRFSWCRCVSFSFW